MGLEHRKGIKMDIKLDLSSSYGAGGEVRTQEWVEIGEIYTEEIGKPYRIGKFMTETDEGVESMKGEEITFDSDF